MEQINVVEKETEINDYLKGIKIWHIVGAVVLFGLAALWHFIYDWINLPSLGWFVAVNESVWEHVKIMYWPAVIFYAVEASIFWKKTNNFLLAKALIIWITPLVNIMIFYTYSGIFDYENFIIDSIVLFITICAQQFVSYKLLTTEIIWEDKKLLVTIFSSVAIALMGVLLVLFTYIPPHIPLFEDGLGRGYGVWLSG